MPVTSNFKSPISNLPPELVNSLFWGSPMGILYESLDGGILSANPAFCSLTGYTETQLRHLDIRSISHPQDFAAEVRLIQQMIQGGSKQQSLRKRYLSRNGTLVWTESTLMLVGEEAEESYLLTFVKDLSDRAAAEQELQQRRQREALLSELTAQIRSTFDLPTILQLAVKRLRQALDTDRVVAVELMSDRSGVCVAEDVNPAYPPMKGQSFPADRISLSYLEPDRCAHLWSLPDVQAEIICESERQLLNQVQVRSMMVVGIQRTEENGHLGVRCGEKSVRSPYLPHSTPTTHWGLLWVHHCHAPRQWTADEQQLVEAVANQMAIAIEQANLVYQLQAYARELEDRVSQRTRSLERSLQFEQLIRHLTETLCIATDEDEVLKAAVEGLVQTLDVDSGYACLYNEQQEIFEVRYEHALGNPGTLRVGQRFPLQNWQAPCQQQVLWGEMCIQQSAVNAHSRGGKPSESAVSGRSLGLKPLELIEKQLTPDNLRTSSANVSSSSFDKDREPLTNWLISPILDERGLIGAVCLFQSLSYDCDASVIKLVKQVTVQCAIAIRQIRLTRKEHSSRVSAEYFRSFLDQSSNVFVEYDPQLRYLSINPAGARYLGQPAAEIIGKTTQELIGVGAEAIEPLVRQVFNTGQRLAINHDICLPAGVRTFETVYAPIADATGTIHRVIGVGQDVTEYRQQWQLLEKQNQQLAAMNGVKEEFIATTSHELRTPLTAILGFSSVLNQQSFGPLNPKQKDYIERIHSSGQHLLELINDILDLSRIEADRLDLELQLVFMKELCESVIALIQERATNQGLTLKVEVDPELEYIIVDPRRLKQMLLNLLTNAIKFTPKGSIGLKIYRAPCSPASINAGSAEGGRFTRTERKGSSPTGNRGNTPRDCTSLRQDTRAQDMIHFMVWDTGIGIDERDQPRLFAPFSQIDSSLSRQYQGTGLGLAITRKLAELHGGWITLESHRDEGSCFTISLPLQETSKALLPRDRQLER